jgi:predicted 2-oxoglutarate/Fe(II)-dependent dioxygenase YbiX
MPLIASPRLSRQVGDVAPLTFGMTRNGAFYSFEAQAGRPAIVILAGTLPFAALDALLQALMQRSSDFVSHEADLVVLVDARNGDLRTYAQAEAPTWRVIFCEPGMFSLWGFENSEAALVVLDRSLRVISLAGCADARAATELALGAVASNVVEPARDILLPAPVLHIPNIFSAAFCDELIDLFEKSPHRAGGMASVDDKGVAFHKIDEGKKRRNDVVLPTGDRRHGQAMAALVRICLPEMKKAFHFEASHTDRILIARYDDTGGYFKRHRDNAAPSVSFRQFALSVNLNSEDYEGGCLLFPEYNSHRYKPGRGAGIIFSSSLLHEATPVTKGRRYVLLTFFHNDEAQARWLAETPRRA